MAVASTWERKKSLCQDSNLQKLLLLGFIAKQQLGFFGMGKRKKVEDEQTSEEERSQDEDIVNVDFEFFDPKPQDFHGAKALLRTYLDDAGWDITGFVDLILSQTTVGTVIKAGEEESPLGLISVLNFGRYKEAPSIQAVKNYLLKHGNEPLEASNVANLWKCQENVGLLINERVLNVPMELCPPLYQALFDEIAWATEDEPSDVLRNSYKFGQYLILTRVYQEVHSKVASTSKSSIKKHKKKKESQDTAGGFIFIKPEDEIFLELSSWYFTFPIQAEAMSAHQTKSMKLLRLVMLISAKQIDKFKSKLKDMVDNLTDG